MPSDMLSPFLELDLDLCKDFLKLSMLEDPISLAKSFRDKPGTFQRALSACPAALSSMERTCGSSSTDRLSSSSVWPLQDHWSRDAELPRTSLLHRIPFHVDRSVSMIESPCLPPPGLSLPTVPGLSSRYKTEQCRTFRENATCKYGAKCQFAHGPEELRGLSRHPKYKTELCRTFHTIGFCPYGARCHFIHNAEEQRFSNSARPPLLRQSLSFAGISSSFSELLDLHEPLNFSRAASTSPPPSTTQSPQLHSPVFPGQRGYSSSEDPIGSHVAAAPNLFSAAPPSHKELGCHVRAPGSGGACSNIGHSFFSSSYDVSPEDLLWSLKGRNAFSVPSLPLQLHRTPSRDSLSDQEQDGYSSSGGSSSSSGCESPGCDSAGRRLPIFSRISYPDD